MPYEKDNNEAIALVMIKHLVAEEFTHNPLTLEKAEEMVQDILDGEWVKQIGLTKREALDFCYAIMPTPDDRKLLDQSIDRLTTGRIVG